MSAIAVGGLRDNWAARFWDSTNGKKVVMAVSGVVLFGFVLGHMAGNLQVFLGPQIFNDYAKFLRSLPAGLWGVRLLLLLMVTLHIVTSVQLALRKRRARPVAYSRRDAIASTYASRTMYWSGPILLVFIIYHLLHFTFGVTGVPRFFEGDVYHNVVTGFQNPIVAGWYVFAMLLLGLHLRHGVWSMFQTLGVSHPRYSRWLRYIAAVFATLIVCGFVAVPVAVQLGVVK